MSDRQRIGVGALSATFRDVQLPMGLRVDELAILGEDIEVEHPPFGLRMQKPAEAIARLSALGLAAFLEAQQPGGLRDFEVQITGGRVIVQANRPILIAMARANAVCTLRLVDGKQVWVDLVSADVMGAPATQLVEGQLAAINPVLDVADLPVPLRLTGLRLEEGWVVLDAVLDPLTV